MELETYQYTWLVILGIKVLFGIRLFVGWWASRRVSTATDYIVAGRRLPIYLAAASIMATWFAAETLMGTNSTALSIRACKGWSSDPSAAAFCLFLSGFLFVRLMQQARYLTVIDFFFWRYGKGMGILEFRRPDPDLLRLDRHAESRQQQHVAHPAGLAGADRA